jgi:hypothetical protein
MAVALPIVIVAVVGHNKGVAGSTEVAPLGVAHIVEEVAGPTVADHIAKVAIEAGPPVVAHTVEEVAQVAIVDYP